MGEQPWRAHRCARVRERRSLSGVSWRDPESGLPPDCGFVKWMRIEATDESRRGFSRVRAREGMAGLTNASGRVLSRW